jgi:hypothetical protein
MTTLKESLKKVKFDIELPNDDGWVTAISIEDVYDVLTTWLTQKRQGIGDKIYSDFRTVAETIFDELLEDLQK